MFRRGMCLVGIALAIAACTSAPQSTLATNSPVAKVFVAKRKSPPTVALSDSGAIEPTAALVRAQSARRRWSMQSVADLANLRPSHFDEAGRPRRDDDMDPHTTGALPSKISASETPAPAADPLTPSICRGC